MAAKPKGTSRNPTNRQNVAQSANLNSGNTNHEFDIVGVLRVNERFGKSGDLFVEAILFRGSGSCRTNRGVKEDQNKLR
jgi:hypothetical protein